MVETTPDTYLDGRSPAYDAVAKKLIATRSILSWILKYCVKEFKDTDLQEIKTHCIIGTPEVAEVPVHPDMTNSLRIRGENAEEKTVSEGVTTFDIRFQAVTPGGDPLTLIINVEAQQSSDVSYPMIKRALYYGSRLISSQNGVEFDHSHYEKIRKVYSIWLCMDTPQGKSGITRYVTQEITEYGSIREARLHYDLQQIVMVYIGNDRRHIRNRLLRMLYDLFKSDESAAHKKKVLEEKYQIELESKEEGMVDTMCNLSVGVYRRGMELGEKRGEIRGEKKGWQNAANEFVLRLLKAKMPLSFIVSMSSCSEDEVRQIAAKAHITLTECAEAHS